MERYLLWTIRTWCSWLPIIPHVTREGWSSHRKTLIQECWQSHKKNIENPTTHKKRIKILQGNDDTQRNCWYSYKKCKESLYKRLLIRLDHPTPSDNGHFGLQKPCCQMIILIWTITSDNMASLLKHYLKTNSRSINSMSSILTDNAVIYANWWGLSVFLSVSWPCPCFCFYPMSLLSCLCPYPCSSRWLSSVSVSVSVSLSVSWNSYEHEHQSLHCLKTWIFQISFFIISKLTALIFNRFRVFWSPEGNLSLSNCVPLPLWLPFYPSHVPDPCSPLITITCIVFFFKFVLLWFST